jgi:hypothetical protein
MSREVVGFLFGSARPAPGRPASAFEGTDRVAQASGFSLQINPNCPAATPATQLVVSEY